jgi:hypothetical protein
MEIERLGKKNTINHEITNFLDDFTFENIYKHEVKNNDVMLDGYSDFEYVEEDDDYDEYTVDPLKKYNETLQRIINNKIQIYDTNNMDKSYIDRFNDHKQIKRIALIDMLSIVTPDTEKYDKANDEWTVSCIDVNNQKKMVRFTNPSFSRNLSKVYYENVYLLDLPHPVNVNDKTSFTFIVSRNEFDKYSISFGRVKDFMEIGAKHSIIVGNNKIIVAGELAIMKMNNNNFEYIININSSKMKHRNTQIDLETRQEKNFYYIIMYYMAFNILKNINPNQNIRIMKYTNIKSDSSIYSYNPYSENDLEILFDAYKNPQDNTAQYVCPSYEDIDRYNQFGKRNKGKSRHGMCVDIVSDNDEFTKTQMINNNGSDSDSDNDEYECIIKNKYLKYKAKYLSLQKKLINNNIII